MDCSQNTVATHQQQTKLNQLRFDKHKELDQIKLSSWIQVNIFGVFLILFVIFCTSSIFQGLIFFSRFLTNLMVTLKKYYFFHLKPGTNLSYIALFPVAAVAAFSKMPVERSSALESRVIVTTYQPKML